MDKDMMVPIEEVARELGVDPEQVREALHHLDVPSSGGGVPAPLVEKVRAYLKKGSEGS